MLLVLTYYFSWCNKILTRNTSIICNLLHDILDILTDFVYKVEILLEFADVKLDLLTVPVSSVDKLKIILIHCVGSNNGRKVLVEYRELPDSDDNSTRLLVETLAVPVRVQFMQLLLDTIVFTHPDCVL